MCKKIKLLSVGKKRAKQDNLRNWEKTVNSYAPEMYELFYTAGESDTLYLINNLHPEIVLLLPSLFKKNCMDGILLVEKIKKIDNDIKVFVNLGLVDEEQEAIEAYILKGAYKCYTPPLIMDTLFHDMYVALNLE